MANPSTPFILKGKVIKRNDGARARGGSATVYRGWYGEEEEAIKDFRSYEHTINRVKKICLSNNTPRQLVKTNAPSISSRKVSCCSRCVIPRLFLSLVLQSSPVNCV
jgi:hypothetical protein